jgi:protein-tyrosine phosphatase
MASVLVVCTGNVCRSPVAEAILRSAFDRRFGARAPSVASAGTAGWVGSAASPGSVVAAAELGLDLSHHRARRLSAGDIRGAILVLAMASEHREHVSELVPYAADRTFALKELVRLTEVLPPPVGGQADPTAGLATRVAEADALRRRGGFAGDPEDEDVEDPLGMPQERYREVTAELDAWCGRLAEGLFGRAPARAAVEER